MRWPVHRRCAIPSFACSARRRAFLAACDCPLFYAACRRAFGELLRAAPSRGESAQMERCETLALVLEQLMQHR